MASTERSLGWATGVAGTDGATAYDTTRMTAMERNTLGTGILLTGSYLALSATASTLTIADGAALINGYFYESNGAVTIAAAGLAAATYNIVIIANTSAGSLTVSANGAGTTTSTTATTRAALITSAQSATIQTAIGATNILFLGTVTVAASSFGTVSSARNQSAKVKGVPNTQLAYLGRIATPLSIPNNTATPIVNYDVGSDSDDANMTVNTVTGEIEIPNGTYMVYARVQWDTNAVGTRQIILNGDPTITTQYMANNTAAQTALSLGAQDGTVIAGDGGGSMFLRVTCYQNSGAARTISNAWFRVVRV
jgi:hypothetical protein